MTMNHLDDTQLARTIAALASTGAGAIHFAVLPSHVQAWWAAGAFFAAIATFQVAWAVVTLTSRHRMFLVPGGIVNAAAVALWIETRIAGLPFGPNAGVPEHIGLAGVLTVVLELSVCAGVLWCLRPHEAWALPSTASSLFAVGSVVVIVGGLAVPGVVAGAEHQHSNPHSHDGGHHGQSHHVHEHDAKGDHAERHGDGQDDPSGKSAGDGSATASPDAPGDRGRSGRERREGHGGKQSGDHEHDGGYHHDKHHHGDGHDH